MPEIPEIQIRNSNGKVRFGLPTTVPGEGPDSSDYFRLQRQLKSIPPHPVKTTLTPKKLASPASPYHPEHVALH